MWRETGDKSIQCVYFNNVIFLVAAGSYSGIKPSYYLVYDIFGEAIEAVSVTWPTFYVSVLWLMKHIMLEIDTFEQVLNKETVNRLVIDGADVASVTEENCNNEMCSYVYYSNFLTPASSVAVDIFGCITERISPANITARENIVSIIGMYLPIYGLCAFARDCV